MPGVKGNQNAKGKHWKLSDETKEKQSIASKIKWQNPEFREKTINSLTITKNTPEKKLEQSRISKEIHSRPEVKEKHKKSMKECSNTPEELERRKQFMLELWQDQDFIKIATESTTELWKTPEYRNKVIDSLTETYKNPELREKLKISTTNLWKDPEFRKSVTESNIETWSNPKILEEHSTLMKEIFKDPKILKELSERTKKLWEDPIYRENKIQSSIKIWKDLTYREKVVASLKEAFKRPEVIAKRSGTNSHRYGVSPSHGKKKYEILTPYQGLVKMFHWDYLLARYMNNIGEKYYYEPHAFPLKINDKDYTYTPDFFVSNLNLYIEIKGYWRGLGKEKSEKFQELYPEHNYVVWFGKDLENLGIKLRGD